MAYAVARENRTPLEVSAVSPVIELSRRRIYILPTRHGFAFAGALLVMVVGSANYSSSLGYMLTFLLASVAVVSILHTYRNLLGLTVQVGHPEPVFAGNRIDIPITLDNRVSSSDGSNDGRHPARHGLALVHPLALPGESRPAKWYRRRERNQGVLDCHLGPNELHTFTLPVHMPRRGVAAVAGLVIASRYPLGLFRAWTNISAEASCVAYPKPAGSTLLPRAALPAMNESRNAGQGREDFAGLRDYRLGDSPRRIHWKAVAKGHDPAVKLFEGSGAAEIELDWAETLHLGDIEAQLSQLCRWVLEADSQGLRFGLRLPHRVLAPALGQTHREHCLAELARFPD